MIISDFDDEDGLRWGEFLYHTRSLSTFIISNFSLTFSWE